MRIAWLLLVSGCVAGLKTSTSSSTSGASMSTPSASSASPSSAPSSSGGAPDTSGQAPEGPNRHPPAGLATQIALTPGPSRQGEQVVGPGGPLSDKEADCSGGKDHCLRGSYFCKADSGWRPVFIFDGKFYTWKGHDCGQDYAFKTVPATAQNIKDGTRILVLVDADESGSRQATSEVDALTTGVWKESNVTAVDAAAGKYTDGSGERWKIANARVMLEWVNAQ